MYSKVQPFVTQFYSYKEYERPKYLNPDIDTTDFFPYKVHELYNEMIQKFLNSSYSYSKEREEQVINSPEIEGFYHEIRLLFEFNFNEQFNFLYGSFNTILSNPPSVELITTGYDHMHWKIRIKADSPLYTVFEIITKSDELVVAKVENGNSLVNAYNEENPLKEHQIIKYNPRIVKV